MMTQLNELGKAAETIRSDGAGILGREGFGRRQGKEGASMSSQQAGPKGTVKVTLHLWRNYDPTGKKKGHRGSGAHLPDGLVWPEGYVEVQAQDHVPSTGKRMVNEPFEWMEAIREALKEAGVKLVPRGYPE